jgi:hypothetical protein
MDMGYTQQQIYGAAAREVLARQQATVCGQRKYIDWGVRLWYDSWKSVNHPRVSDYQR